MKRCTCIGIIKLYTKEILQNNTIEVSNRNCYCQSVELNIPQELTVPLSNLSVISSETFLSSTIPVQTVEMMGAMTELFPLLQFRFVVTLAASAHTGQVV